MNAHGEGFRLEELRVEPVAGEVSGPGGRVKLDPKVMDVLALMAEHGGQVVSREELLARLWPGVVVTDDALTRCFYELRRQLSLAGGDEKYRALIETLPKRGYRLNGKVMPADGIAPVSQSGRPARGRAAWVIALSAVAVLVAVSAWLVLRAPQSPSPATGAAVPKSIAVLPFADMSESQDQQYFADGIAEEILDRLANNAAPLRVIARTSSFAFRNQASDVPEIAAKLNVSHVLEGSVRRAGDRVRVTAQLVEGSNSVHVWSQTYDRRLGDIFAIQNDIAASVAAALEVALSGRPLHGSAPSNPEAYANFLEGEFFYNRRAHGDIERAVRQFETAVARDPHYARAWAALAGAYSLMWWDLGLDPAIWKAREGHAARKAVELDPTLLDARMRLAQFLFNSSDRAGTREQLRRAAVIAPHDPWLKSWLRSEGAWQGISLEERVREEREMLQSDPLSTINHMNFGLVLFATGRLDEAKTEFRKVQELNPELGDVELEIGRVLVAQRRYAEAQAEFRKLPAQMRDYGMALLLDPGLRAKADAALARLKARSGDRMHGIRVAEALALRQRPDESFATLFRARDAIVRDEAILSRLWFFQHELRYSPFLKTLHPDARWRMLMAEPRGRSADEIIEELWPGTRTADAG